MQRHLDGNSSRVLSRPNAFAPEFLAQLQESPEPLTASEADLSGPWKLEVVPGHPGAVAVLREWESLDKGDLPEAVFLDRETAALFAAILPVVDREPLYHEGETATPEAPLTSAHPLISIYGEQGPRVCGWVRRFSPKTVEALHLVEGLVRTPRSLAEVLLAAGGGALEQVGRYLAERQWA